MTLPPELEDYIPEVEHFYKNEHSGRKLTWHHLMSSGVINFATKLGKFELEITTFQMAVLFAWSHRASEKLSFESLRLATELPEVELRRTLWQLVAFQKLKHQVLCYSPEVKSPKEFRESTAFWVNQDFCIVRNGKAQFRGKLNLVGRLQLSTEKNREEENQEIVYLRTERVKVNGCLGNRQVSVCVVSSRGGPICEFWALAFFSFCEVSNYSFGLYVRPSVNKFLDINYHKISKKLILIKKSV